MLRPKQLQPAVRELRLVDMIQSGYISMALISQNKVLAATAAEVHLSLRPSVHSLP